MTDTHPPNNEALREKLITILDERQIENIPKDLWETIHATWTGLWVDYHGSLDEMQASDIYSVSDLLSDDRAIKLIDQILNLISADRSKFAEEVRKQADTCYDCIHDGENLEHVPFIPVSALQDVLDRWNNV